MRKEIENKRDQMGYARVFQYEVYEGLELRTFCGLVNRNNEEIVPCKYHNIIGFWNDAPLAVVEISDKYGYINKQGKEVTPICYDFADDRFYCGLASVERDGKRGFVDSNGREVGL